MVLARVLLNGFVAGALAGILSITVLGPRFIEWDNTAGQGDGFCVCGPTARRGAETLVTYQVRGLGAGAFVGLGAALALVWRRRRKAPAAGSAAPPA
ncbi:MAG: hypothetical protein INH41_06310 [Myxococcaceae bacterium]|jgi:hypothetical protein|nr:hypothetical protein [Myxococcaceae bacterium]MCA3012001.1 hypothetical protein [Myxococcaceae bacterium]